MYLLSMLPPASAKAATRRAVLGVAILQVLLNGETKPIKLDDVQEAMQNMKHRQQALKKTSGWMVRFRGLRDYLSCIHTTPCLQDRACIARSVA